MTTDGSAVAEERTVPVTAPDERPWRDRKRLLWLLGLAVPLLPLGGWEGFRATGAPVFLWMGPIWILVVIPLLDWVVGEDRSNAPESAMAKIEASLYYRWCTWLYLPLQFVGLVWATWIISTTRLGWAGFLGWAFTVGAVGGIGIANAHELGHKRDDLERWLSRIVLAQTGYGHFYVEHNRGHHSRVATPEDPASARLGESFWAFLPRTVIGGLRSGWALEKGRLDRHGLCTWSVRNKILQAWAMSVALFGALIGAFGVRVVPFLVIQAVFGFSLLEVVNYVEHYGLLRQKAANGRYERCQACHSWNSNHVASNVFLYNLERHSDHHANPTRRYQTLRHFDDAPQLPSGYGLMLGMAYMPPLWRKVMDKRVLALYGGDITKANIHPPKRAKLLAKYR
jgi:alkane 1-monooxygenase